MAHWDEMHAAYAADSLVDISWYRGSGAGFVEASAKHYDSGARSLHQIGPSLIELEAERALADTGCAVVIIGAALHGAEVNVISHARMRNRLVREAGQWRIAGLRVIYQYDMFVPVNPSDQLQVDGDKLASFRTSYRSLSYIQYASGLAHYSPRDDLPGVDRPDLVDALIATEQEWLRNG